MRTKKESNKANETNITDQRYTKPQLIGADRYRNKRDILSVVLEDDKEYSFDEAEEAVNRFLKGKVR